MIITVNLTATPIVALESPLCLTMVFKFHSIQPVILVIFEGLATALAIGFIPASSKCIRLLGFAFVAVSAYVTILTTLRYVPRVLWASILAGNASTYVLRYLDLVLFDGWSFETRGPTISKRFLDDQTGEKTTKLTTETAASPRPVSTWRRLQFGFGVTINPRQVNTRYQVKNVPRWSPDELQHVPSRVNFLRRTVTNIFLSYLIVDLCSLGAQPERNATLFSHDKVALFAREDRLTSEEALTRILASLILWLNIYCVFRILHGIIGFLAVGSGLSKVTDWPSPFGQLSEAYSVRQFWGYVYFLNSKDPDSNCTIHICNKSHLISCHD